MDKMTQRLWDAEFEKQYPKPEGDLSDSAESLAAFLKANTATQKSPLGFFAVAIISSWKSSFEALHITPWSKWRTECLDRFQAIYKAQPLQALEALRSGNLLID